MKIRFLGVGSAFTTPDYYQSNAVVIADSGKRLLLDCGSDARFAAAEQKLGHRDFDAVYISHLHADHIGGMEWLAFMRFFDKGAGEPPHLFMVDSLMEEMWENSLRGGLESIEGQMMTLTSYFRCHPIEINSSFVWEGIEFTPVQTVHIMAGYRIKNSYGLLIKPSHGSTPEVFFTTDTQFCPTQISKFYASSKVIFQDCETSSSIRSGVHAHYEELKTLPEATRRKMWLYHYQPNPKQDAKADGFAGFVRKGQEFDF